MKSMMDKPAAHSGQSQFYVLHSSKKQKHKLPDCTHRAGEQPHSGSSSASWAEGECVTAHLSSPGSDVEKEERQARHFLLVHGTWGGDGKRTRQLRFGEGPRKTNHILEKAPVTVTARLFSAADNLPGAYAATGSFCPQAISTCSHLCVTAQDSGFIPSFPSKL